MASDYKIPHVIYDLSDADGYRQMVSKLFLNVIPTDTTLPGQVACFGLDYEIDDLEKAVCEKSLSSNQDKFKDSFVILKTTKKIGTIEAGTPITNFSSFPLSADAGRAINPKESETQPFLNITQVVCLNLGEAGMKNFTKFLSMLQFPVEVFIYNSAGPHQGLVTHGSNQSRKLFLKFSESLRDAPGNALSWLWHNILLSGAVNLFVGLPDMGKTLVAVHIISRLTTGTTFPFSKKAICVKKTVVICKEDDYKNMWIPRLTAAGADIDMVIPVYGIGIEGSDELIPWSLDVPEHLVFLKELLSRPDIGLCLIDPIGDMLSTKDLNKAKDVRDVMGPLTKVAQETGVAFIVNAHSTKALVDSVIKTAAGSIQLMAAVQVSWWFQENPSVNGQKLMLSGRNKSGKKRGFVYAIESAPWPDECQREPLEEGEEDDGVGLVKFISTTDVTANDVIQKAQDKDASITSRIKRWLNELLANGPVPTERAITEMDTREFVYDNVSKVCTQMKVIRDKKTWSLPLKESEKTESLF